MLTIYGRKSSFNVQKVMWLVAELGLEHRHIELGGSFGGLDTPEFLAMNPHGRVPVIDDDHTIVWESHAVLRYLAATYGTNGASGTYGDTSWWSEDPKERSQVDRWVDWSATTLQPDFLNGIFWGYYRTPEAQRDTAAIARAVARVTQHMKLLDRHLAGQPFMAGASLSLADIAAGAHLYRYFNVDIPHPEVPNVRRWYQSLQNRPGYRQHVMLPFGELFGRLAY